MKFPDTDPSNRAKTSVIRKGKGVYDGESAPVYFSNAVTSLHFRGSSQLHIHVLRKEDSAYKSPKRITESTFVYLSRNYFAFTSAGILVFVFILIIVFCLNTLRTLIKL